MYVEGLEAIYTVNVEQVEKQTIIDLTEGGVGDDCTVCLDEMKLNEDRCLLGCSGEHVFHEHCIKKWLRQKDSCPVCREPTGGTTFISK